MIFIKGWLVVNGFLNTNKFNEIYDILKTAFKKRGHTIDVYTNIEMSFVEDIYEKPDFAREIFIQNQFIRLRYGVFSLFFTPFNMGRG